MSVPLPLRLFVDKACRLPLARRAGTWAYWRAAGAAARRFSACPGVVAVRLRGGMARGGCRPGISDLDFTVVTEDTDEAQERRQTAKTIETYRRLKGLFPMLGELTLVPRARWTLFESVAPGPWHWYRSELEYRRGDWAEIRRERLPHPASLFSLAYDHFTLALKALRVASAYGRIVFEKEIAKASSIAGAADASMEECFLALDRLAAEALEWAAPPAPDWFPARPDPEPDPKALLSDWAVGRVIREAAGSDLAAGEAPFTVVGPTETASRWLPFAISAAPHPIAPLSPAMAECLRRGWSGWWAREPLAWFGAQADETRRRNLFRNLVERLCHDSVSVVPARALLAAPGDRARWLHRIVAEIRAAGRSLNLDPRSFEAESDLDLAVSAAREAALVVLAAERQRTARDSSRIS